MPTTTDLQEIKVTCVTSYIPLIVHVQFIVNSNSLELNNRNYRYANLLVY